MNLSRLTACRRMMEDVHRLELLEAERAVREASARYDTARADSQAMAEGYAAAMASGLSPQDVELRYAEVDAGDRRVRESALALEVAQRAWETRREALIDASRERRKLERLEQRDAWRHRVRLLRLEQETLDEAAQVRFVRQTRARGEA